MKRENSSESNILAILRRDAIIYYSVIFSITLVLTLMIAFAEPGIRNITAQLQLLITVTMMSRITIHVKKQHGRQRPIGTDVHEGIEMTQSMEIPNISLRSVFIPQFEGLEISFDFIHNVGRKHNTETLSVGNEGVV